MCSDEHDQVEKAIAEAMRHRVLRAREAAEFCAISLSHLRRLHARGKLPAPVRLGERRLGWRLGDLIVWLADRQTSNPLQK
jgi:predicted DNA-binding transcriptional regulator AlpA